MDDDKKMKVYKTLSICLNVGPLVTSFWYCMFDWCKTRTCYCWTIEK